MSESLAVFDSFPLLGIVGSFVIFFLIGFFVTLGFNAGEALVKCFKSFLSVHFQKK